MLKRIAEELERHAPFTALGAATGIGIMLIIVLGNVPSGISDTIFYVLHPTHVVLSALATTAMYMKYRGSKFWLVLLIGWTGSIGIATISDVIIPHLGGLLLARGAFLNVQFNTDIEMPFMSTEAMPFIEVAKWKVVNLAALTGIALGYWKHTTSLPHFGHVLLSTWASLFYLLYHATINSTTITQWFLVIFTTSLFLFLSVWIPCCTSDIVYPLLFVAKDKKPAQETTQH